MPKIELGDYKVSYAKRFYEILNNPNFKWFSAKPKSVGDEKAFLKKMLKDEKKGMEKNYAIFYDGVLVGGCGLKFDQHRKHNCELGYFLDEAYWGKGITTEASRQVENIAFRKFKMRRIEIVMNPENKGSVRVAEKLGYRRVGVVFGKVLQGSTPEKCYLYEKFL